MKNLIEYYYDMKVSKIHQRGRKYYFYYNGFDYILMESEFLDTLEYIKSLSDYLYGINILVQTIVPTKNMALYVSTNNLNYVLLKVNSKQAKINYNDIFKLNTITFKNELNPLRRDNWYELWTNKVDYFEYQLSQIGKKYKLIKDSFSYYVGLAENAILIFNLTDKKNLNLTLSHKRLNYNATTIELYNPLNFVIDYRVRDICEYFKSCFFNDININEDIIKYLEYNNLNEMESCIFFSRMLYPSYYFDLYEKILIEGLSEDELNKIINKADDYEKLLKKVYYLLKQNNKLPNIDWLN